MSEQYKADSLIVIQANIAGTPILLPSSAIAEIIDYTSPITGNEGEEIPEWFSGQLSWRGLNVPLVSLERLNGHAEPNSSVTTQAKIVVTHFSQKTKKTPYWAFVTASTPRMHRLDAEELKSSDLLVENKQAAAMWALLNGEPNLLLDLNFIEQQLEALKY